MFTTVGLDKYELQLHCDAYDMEDVLQVSVSVCNVFTTVGLDNFVFNCIVMPMIWRMYYKPCWFGKRLNIRIAEGPKSPAKFMMPTDTYRVARLLLVGTPGNNSVQHVQRSKVITGAMCRDM